MKIFRSTQNSIDIPAMNNAVDVSIWGTFPNQISVNSAETAMKLAAVYRCTDILASSIASIPLQMKVKKDSVYQYDESEPMNYLLEKKPNPMQNAWEMKCNAVLQMLNTGNAYILPEYGIDKIKRLTLLTQGSVAYDLTTETYLINDWVNHIYKTVSGEEIIHLRNLSLDGGRLGSSVIQYAARVMSIGASADEKSLDSFQPGSSLKGFISGSGQSIVGMGEVQDTQMDSVTNRIEKEIQSGKKIFRVPGDMKFNPLSLSPSDLQLLQTKELTVKDVCRFYGVHPDKVFASQSENYKASEMSQVDFINDTMIPRLRKIEAEFNTKLIDESIASKYKIEFDLESIYQTSLESMGSYIKSTIETGVYTINEWRKKKGLPPIAGGDEPLASANLIPLNSSRMRGEKEKVSP